VSNYVAYAFRSGRIHVGKKAPKGAIPIANGTQYKLRRIIGALARHGYTRGVLLVPGVPEANNEQEAIKALGHFSKWVKGSLTKGKGG